MSLFKSREWWAVSLNENEMYDSQCLLVFTLDKDRCQSVFLGSHEGYLRLYSPSSELIGDGIVSGYKPSHLLLEVQLPSPILQISEGIFVSGSHDKYLAVLHPRLFSVYAIKKKESTDTETGNHVLMELSYRHSLRHSAHSFVTGSFGGVRGRHFICIQSLDGLLSFYEQESFAFQIYLPTFVLPSTFTYLEKTDSFLFLDSSLTINCYSYEALASAGNSNDKRVTKTWDYNLGEGILDVKTLIKNGLKIVVLSEKNLLGLNENGKLMFMKRLEYRPICFSCYLTQENKTVLTIVANDSHFLHLYEDVNLKWSLKIDLIPVSLDRIFLANLPGGIVLLSENGFLQIIYLGTHPSVYLVPPLIQPEINLQKAESELKQLQQKISDNDIADPLTVNEPVTVDVKLDKNVKIERGLKTCNVIVEINPQCLLNKIQVLFVVEYPLSATVTSAAMTNFCEKTFVESDIYLSEPGHISSLNVLVVVSYVTNEGVVRSVRQKEVLPLNLVVVEQAAIKEARHRITIMSNKPVAGVDQLFREFSGEDVSPNAIGLKFVNSEEVVTVLSAKSSQRYRLQSDSVSAMSLILHCLVARLKNYFRKEPDFCLTSSSSLPLDAYFEAVRHHHRLITQVGRIEENLSKETCQYKAVQKKILTNLKDVAPKSSSNLHGILKDTIRMIMSSLEELETKKQELIMSGCQIGALSRFMRISLLELTAMTEEDAKIVKTVFNPFVHDTDEQGWLEVQEATASNLLRTVLAKSSKDQQKPKDIFLEPMADASKLIKHFSAVVDRVTKGTHLLERNEFESKKETSMTVQAAYEQEENFFDEVIPAGSKLINLENARNLKEDNRVDSVVISEKPTTSDNGSTLRGETIEDTSRKTPKVNVPRQESVGKIGCLGSENSIVPVEANRTRNKADKIEKNDDDEDDEDDDDAIWDVKIEEMHI